MKVGLRYLIAIVAVWTLPAASVATTCLQICESECSLTNSVELQERCRSKCRGMIQIMDEFGLKRDTFLCKAVPSRFVAENYLKNGVAKDFESRFRRLFKAHGRWCGPNWTDGKPISSEDYMRKGGDFRGHCIDDADCACRLHDEQCAMAGRCCKSHDRTLIKNLEGTNSPWIIRGMRIASWTRKC